MSDTHEAPHAAAEPHGIDTGHGEAGHGDEHGHDEHGHDGQPLGPIDWPMWGAGVLGVAVAILMTAVFVASTGFVLGA